MAPRDAGGRRRRSVAAVLLVGLGGAAALGGGARQARTLGRGARLGATRETGVDFGTAEDAAAAPAAVEKLLGQQAELEELEGFGLVRRLDGAELARWRSAEPRPQPTPLSTLSLVLKVYDDIPKVLGLNEEDAIAGYRTALFASFVVGAFLANGPVMDWLLPMPPPPMMPPRLDAPTPPTPVELQASIAALRQNARDADLAFQARWIWSAFFNFLPLSVGFAGLFARDALDEGLLRVRCAVDPAFRRRVTFHECGHLLTAYLCGLPVTGAALKTGVEVDLVGAMKADAAGRGDREEPWAGGPASNGEAWRQKIMQGTSGVEVSNEDRGAPAGLAGAVRVPGNARFWPEPLLNRVCVVSMGGIMAEVLHSGEAKGGSADMRSLEGILYAAIPETPLEPRTELEEQAFGPRANPADGERQDRVRWSAVEAFTLLKTHETQLRALVQACGVDPDADGDAKSGLSLRSPLAPPVAFPPIADVVRIIESS